MGKNINNKYMSRKFIYSIMALLVAILCCTSNADAAEKWEYKNASNGKFSGGNGSENNPYLISKAQDLADLAYLITEKNKEFKGTFFKMTTDITLNDISFGANGQPTSTAGLKEWTPIGKYGFWSDNDFEGDFNGDGHSVSGLYFGAAACKLNYVGLFGSIKNASVRGVTVKDSYMCLTPTCKYSYFGMLIGRVTKGVVQNCHVTGSMLHLNAENKEASFGGLIGYGDGSSITVEGCTFGGTMECKDMGAGAYIGGMMACSDGTGLTTKVYTIRNCSTEAGSKMMLYHDCNDGKDHGSTDVEGGGIYGTEGDNVYINDCVNRMDIHVERRGQHVHDHAWTVNIFNIAASDDTTKRCANFGSIYFGTKDEKLWNIRGTLGFMGMTHYVYNSVNYGKLVTNIGLDDGVMGEHSVHLYMLCDTQHLYCNPNGINCFIVPKESVFTYGKEVIISTQAADYTLEQMKTGFFVDELNKKVGENIWGVYESSDQFNGCPLPISCGGKPKTIGNGTKDNPYAISSESVLRELLRRIKKGDIDPDSKYFRLDTDLDLLGCEPLSAIASKDKPFKGDFDGNGHVISNVTLKDNSLFGYIDHYGTIHDLTLLNVTFDGQQSKCAPIAYNNNGKVSNCCIGGHINMTAPAEGDASLAGVCFTTEKYGGKSFININNCYVKGDLNISGCTGKTTFYGLVACEDSGNASRVHNSYASFDANGNPSNKEVYGLSRVYPKSGYGWINPEDCRYVYNGTDLITDQSSKGLQLTSDSELSAHFTDAATWLTGAYRPVLKSGRHYAVTAYDNAKDKVYMDAIPMGNGTNDIYNCNLGDADNTAYTNDPLLFGLPNIAIYNPAGNTDYLLFCDLDPTKPFNYTPNPESERQVAGSMTYKLALTEQQGSCRYMLCMPTNIYANNLPEGCKLMIASPTSKDTEFEGYDKVNLIQCDSIDAGVPFILYVPKTVTDKSLDIIMRGTLKSQPLQAIDLPTANNTGRTTYTVGMTGTFKATDDMDGVCSVIQDGATLGIHSLKDKTAIAPFRAYVTPSSDAAGVRFVDYLLLDETSDLTNDIIAANDGMHVNVKLKRGLKANQWNTICLPFDMTADEVKAAFGEGTKIEKLNSASYADGVCNLQFGAETEIKAGTAYLLKPSEVNANGVYSFVNKLINYAALEKDPKSLVVDGETFSIELCGNYERLLLAGGDDGIGSVNGNVYFVQQDKIYKVADGQTVMMNGFRGYILASSSKATQALSSARMLHSDGSTTSLRLVEVGTNADGRIYNIQGMEVSEPTQNGVYIKDGRKFVKK